MLSSDWLFKAGILGLFGFKVRSTRPAFALFGLMRERKRQNRPVERDTESETVSKTESETENEGESESAIE